MGRSGRTAVREHANRLRLELELDFLAANAENAAGGIGLTPRTARDLFQSGVDVLTTGNHVWKHKELRPYLDEEQRVLRPANYPAGPGSGMGVFQGESGPQVAVLNLMGRTYMEAVDCPFQTAETLLASLPVDVKVRLVDFHAEATSEKKALAYFLQDKVTAVLGTHTHVQTNDACILGQRCGFITDLGMCGAEDSVLGMDKDIIVERFYTRLPMRFEPAQGEACLCGAALDVDEAGRTLNIYAVRQSAAELRKYSHTNQG